jgi:hypothetical protein
MRKSPRKSNENFSRDSRRGRAAKLITRTLASGTGAAALVGGAYLVDAAANAVNQTKGYESDRAIALRSVNEVYGNVIVLQSGATYRVTPNDYGEADNVAHTVKVKPGEELVVEKPAVSVIPPINILDQDGWIGFTPPGAQPGEFTSSQDRAEVTVWANLPKLQDDGLAQVYADTVGISQTLEAHVTDTGAISINGVVDPYAATSFIEKAGAYEQAAHPQQ